MNEIYINKSFYDRSVEMRWRLQGSGICRSNLQDEYFNECVSAFCAASDIDTELKVKGENKVFTDNMSIMGELFACGIMEISGKSKGCAGMGKGFVQEDNSFVCCELYLPGRTAWVYEISSKDTSRRDRRASDFFGRLAETAELRLNFSVSDYSGESGVLMFAAFGKALKQACLKL